MIRLNQLYLPYVESIFIRIRGVCQLPTKVNHHLPAAGQGRYRIKDDGGMWSGLHRVDGQVDWHQELGTPPAHPSWLFGQDSTASIRDTTASTEITASSESSWRELMLGSIPTSTGSMASKWGRAIAQAVSRRLPTAEARVRVQVRSCEICGGRSDIEAGFFRVLRFPLPILIPPTDPRSSSGACTIWSTYQVNSVSPPPKKLSKLN
jgi:hypothetical protein